MYRACKEHPFHTLLQVGCCLHLSNCRERKIPSFAHHCHLRPTITATQLFALKHGNRVREKGAASAYEAIPQLKEKVEAAQVR